MCEYLYWSHICPNVTADCWLMFCCTLCTYVQLNDDHFVIKTIKQGIGDKSFLFYYFMMNVQYFGCRLIFNLFLSPEMSFVKLTEFPFLGTQISISDTDFHFIGHIRTTWISISILIKHTFSFSVCNEFKQVNGVNNVYQTFIMDSMEIYALSTQTNTIRSN